MFYKYNGFSYKQLLPVLCPFTTNWDTWKQNDYAHNQK